MTRCIISCLVYIMSCLCYIHVQAQTEHYVIKYLSIDNNNNNSIKRIRIGKRLCAINDTICDDAIIQWGNIRQMNIYNVNNKSKQYVLKRIDFKNYKTIAQYMSRPKNQSDQTPGGKRGVFELREEALKRRKDVYDYDIKDSISVVLSQTSYVVDSDTCSQRLLQGVIDMANRSIKAEFSIDSTSNMINYEKRLALIIGNSDYNPQTGFKPLETPSFDAEDISEILRDSLGFDVITVLNRDKECILKYIKLFDEKMSDIDTEYKIGLFYYAGHGGSFRGNDFIIPIGKNKEEMFITYQDVVEGLQKSGKPLLVFFDACRSETENFNVGNKKDDEYGKKDRTMIMTSVAPNRTADDGIGNSPFAEVFMNSICQKNIKTIEVLYSIQQIRHKAANEKPRVIYWKTPSKDGNSTKMEDYMLRPTDEIEKSRWYWGPEVSFSTTLKPTCGFGLHGGVYLWKGWFGEIGTTINYLNSDKLHLYDSSGAQAPSESFNYNFRWDIFARIGCHLSRNSKHSFALYGELSHDYFFSTYSKGDFNVLDPSINARYVWKPKRWWSYYCSIGMGFPKGMGNNYDRVKDAINLKSHDFRIQIGINYRFKKKVQKK